MARPTIVWTDEMLEQLVCDYPVTPDRVLAERLHVSSRSIQRKAREMRLTKAMKGRANFEVWMRIEELFGKYSYRQIAEQTHVSVRTVSRICKKLKLKLEKEDAARHRSEAQIKMIRSERRRLIFGLEQRTDRCIGYDKGRRKALELLAQHGYVTIKGSRTAYYSDSLRRAEHIESYAKALGINIEYWETE